MTKREFFQKITKDLLVSFLITYFFLFVPEVVLPGIVSSHFNPKIILYVLFILGGLYIWLRNSSLPPKENLKFRSISKHLVNGILFVIFAMLLLSLYRMRIWQIVIVAIFSLALIIVSERIIIRE